MKKRKKIVKLNIVGEITPETLSQRVAEDMTLVDVIRACDNPNVRLEIFLSSPGGDIDPGLAIYELLRCSRAEVAVYGYGLVGSIAVLLLMAGDERYLSPGTRVFVHPGSVMSEIPESLLTLKAKSAELMGLHTWYCEELFSRCVAAGGKIDIAKVYEICDKDTFFGVQTALEWGFATKIHRYTK